MSALFQDLRYGLRMMAKNPGFTVLAVLTLALGIGANSTIFSWINSTLLNPIPGQTHTAELVSVMRGERSEHPTPPFSYPDYVDIRASNQSLSGLLAYHDDYIYITGSSKPERVYGASISANYFQVLGVQPILGRGLLPGEEEKPGSVPSVMISYGLWQSHFGGDLAIVGKSIQLNRVLGTIVGVTPPEFQGCKTGLRTDLWVSLGNSGAKLRSRDDFWLQVLGRLKPGVTRQQAEQELNLRMQRIVEQFPDSHRGPNQISLDPLWRSPFGANVYMYKTLPMLLALAAVLLLLACANVANLLLVRSVTRRREIALRLSMGASRWRLVRQLLAETLLLGLAAGVAAVVLTTWTARTFAAFFPPTANIPLTLNGHVDGTVFLVTMAISILAAMVFGILPGAAHLPAGPHCGFEGGGQQRVERAPEAACVERVGGFSDRPLAASADLCGLVRAELAECPAAVSRL